MEIATLGIDVAKGNLGTKSNVCPSIVHSLSFQTLLELGAHEPISISRVLEDHEVDLEDSHVDSDGKDDEA